MKFFVPITTALRRYKDRARITSNTLKTDDDDEAPKVIESGVTDQIEKIVVGINRNRLHAREC